jgi:hypothetical protein
MPRIINNNLVIVPAVPIQTGSCGVPAITPCMPGVNALQNDVMVNNGIMMNNVVPSGTAPAGSLSGFTCNANFETTQCVMEPPLMCAPTLIHHHNRVQHMVPCIKTNIHHVHNHHEWLPFVQSEVNEAVNHSHGVRPSDQQLCNSAR